MTQVAAKASGQGTTAQTLGQKQKLAIGVVKCGPKKSVTNITKGEEESVIEKGVDAGLWENIEKKKKRMGKNYKPSKPGDKDYPSKKAIKKAQSADEEKDFKPHTMFNPKTGKSIKAETYKQHLELKEQGFTHEKPAK